MDSADKNVSNIREVNRTAIHLVRLHHRLCEKRLQDLPIHRSQHLLLMHLSHCKEPPSQKEIAEHLEISPAAVTATLKKLHAEGYIIRASVANDNRMNEIVITEKGRSVIEESRKIFDEIDAKMYHGISSEELSQTLHTLEILTNNIKTLLQGENK